MTVILLSEDNKQLSVPISDAKVGDKLLSFDKQGKPYWDEVIIVDPADSHPRNLVHILVEGSEHPLVLTNHHFVHKIDSEGQMVSCPSREIQCGDIMLSPNSQCT